MKSKDYNRLYQMICANEIVPAFVDYKFPNDIEVYRDICSVRKLGDFDIQIGARGTCYGSVYSFDKEKGLSEYDLFVKQCKRLNLEFFDF